MPQHADPITVAASSKQRTYLGACECGTIRYRVDVDLGSCDPRTGSVWEQSVPAASFHLLTGHDHVIGYQFAREDAHHFFCAGCQARAFSVRAPGTGAYYSIDVKALRKPTPDAPSSSAPGASLPT